MVHATGKAGVPAQEKAAPLFLALDAGAALEDGPKRCGGRRGKLPRHEITGTWAPQDGCIDQLVRREINWNFVQHD